MGFLRHSLSGGLFNYFSKVKGVFELYLKKQNFQKQLSNFTPVIFITPQIFTESNLEPLLKNYAGIILWTNNFNSGNSDWRIRMLYRHGILQKKPIKIVTLIEDPVSINVKHFLNINDLINIDVSLFPVEKIDELRDKFLDTFDHEWGNRWFDNEVKPILGIDIYQSDFLDIGHATFSRDNIQFLVMKIEGEQQLFSAPLLDFLNVIILNTFVNESLKADIESVRCAKYLTDHLVFPLIYLQKVCNSRYFRRFFSDANLDAIILKWCDFRQPIPSEVFKDIALGIDMQFPNAVFHDLNVYKFWFIDIPRTSSSSIKVELGNRFGIVYGKSRLLEKNLSRVQIIPNHIPSILMKKMLGDKLWRSLFKFTIVRNPWDRMVSIFEYRRIIHNIPDEMLFRDYIRLLSKSRGTGLFHYHGFYYSNAEYVLGDHNEILVDHIGRYETRQDDLRIIAGKIQYPELGNLRFQVGKPNRPHYSHYYDDETNKIISEMYSSDIEMFNYYFEEK